MSTKTLDKTHRSITEQHDTTRENIVFVIHTTHAPAHKVIRTTIHRRKLTPVGFQQVHLDTSDPCPVAPATVPCARYSLRALEAAHADFIAAHVAATAQHAIIAEWAERY